MKVFLKTYGCQMNEYDSEQVGRTLESAGYRLVSSDTHADVILFNTCSVRQHAEERVLGQLRMLKKRKKENPHLIIGIMGCMANAYKETLLKDFSQLDFVSGTKDFVHIVDMLNAVVDGHEQKAFISEGVNDFSYNPLMQTASALKAFVPIMRGCDNYCSYCIVPYVRGREESRPSDSIVSEIADLVGKGVKEVTLLGQNVNSYGKGLKEGIDFPELLNKVSKVTGLQVIRFLTSHPKDVSEKLFKVMRDNPKVEKHLHLPLQSGSDTMLQKMNRKYTADDYRRNIALLKKYVPDASVTTDLIVGFCGESEEAFEETVTLYKDVRFDSAFIFKYSTRKGTKACQFDDDVSMADKKRRNQVLLDLQREMTHARNQERIGSVVKVLVEDRSKKKKSQVKGRTLFDREVVCDGSESEIGTFVTVKITGSVHDTLLGERVDG